MRDLVSGGGPEEEEEDEADQMLRLRLPANAPRWKRAAAHLLHRRLRLPEALVALLLAVRPRFWLGLLAWMGGARLAAGHELGPLYIITTIFLLMLLNLGQRKEGEWSACEWRRAAAGPGCMCGGALAAGASLCSSSSSSSSSIMLAPQRSQPCEAGQWLAAAAQRRAGSRPGA